MTVPSQFVVRAIRDELGLSQSDLAAMACVSVRAIQSYEQGWRQPSEMVGRVLLLLLIAHRNGSNLSDLCCWDHKKCSTELRDRCIAYLTRQGHLCWFFTGTMCAGKRLATWSAKLDSCLACSFMQGLLDPTLRETEPPGPESDCVE